MRLSPHAVRVVLGGGLLLASAAAQAAPGVARVTTQAGAAAASAVPGDVLVIQGSGFGGTTGEVWLDRGGFGREAEVLEWNGSAGLIRVRIPNPADLGAVKLIIRSGTEGSDPFPFLLTATPPPAPASPPPPLGTLADPLIRAVNVLGGAVTTSGTAGTRVQVSGARLGSGGVLRFNGVPAVSTTVWSMDYIVAILPNAPGTGPITVRRNPGLADEATGTGPLFTILPAPLVSGYARAGAAVGRAHPGDEISLRGTNLGTGGQVLFQGVAATVRSWSPQEIVIVVPPVEAVGPFVVVLNPRTGAEVRAQGPPITVAAGG